MREYKGNSFFRNEITKENETNETVQNSRGLFYFIVTIPSKVSHWGTFHGEDKD
jgi:hypothetical protein